MARKTQGFSTTLDTDAPAAALSVAPFLTQDLAAVKNALDGIQSSADGVSKSLTKAFADATINSKAFSNTLTGVATALASVLAQSLSGPLSSGFSSILGGFTGGGEAPSVAPFADGGIVASPKFFGGGGSVGLMGERGAEAILPLSRGPNGQLGIASQGANARPLTMNVTIATSDAESFRRSEAQVAGALARAVSRGQRAT